MLGGSTPVSAFQPNLEIKTSALAVIHSMNIPNESIEKPHADGLSIPAEWIADDPGRVEKIL